MQILVTFIYLDHCGRDCKNTITVSPADRKRQQKGTEQRSLGSPSSSFSPTKIQGAEGEGRIKSPQTLNVLSWLLPLSGDIRR